MNDLKGRTVRIDGSVVNTNRALTEILYSGRDLSGCIIDDVDEAERFKIANILCDTDIPAPIFSKDLIYDNITWRNHWFTPEPYASINLLEWCLAKCSDQNEEDRVKIEIDEFEKRGMVPAIKHMIYCVDTWRQHKIVWGVGRGSSVSSFVLYLIGITRLNPLKYNLDIAEWLK